MSRTPLRVSLVGGGTDLPCFCSKERGSVVSVAIQKYVYIMSHPSFDDEILLSYSRTERVKDVEEIQNTRAREVIKKTGIKNGIEIHCDSEVPTGTGLGGSSSFTVGLLNALYAHQGRHSSPEKLAKEACEIEIETLQEPIGRQDQYAAAYGGINKITFNNGEVTVRPIIFQNASKKRLEENLMLFYLGTTREAAQILKRQNQGLAASRNFQMHQKMRDLADRMEADLLNNSLDSIGNYLHENWLLKRELAQGLTNPAIDEVYRKALALGASGGKLLGAGGGGFMLLYACPEKQEVIRAGMGLKEMPLEFDMEGSKIIYANN